MNEDDEEQGENMFRRLPPELLRELLNGAALDPRWRFAARGVCRMWRDTLARASRRSLRPPRRRRWSDRDRWSDEFLDRWARGAVLCASAAAERPLLRRAFSCSSPERSILVGEGEMAPMAETEAAETLEWCAQNSNASRKEAAVAVVACRDQAVGCAALRRLLLPPRPAASDDDVIENRFVPPLSFRAPRQKETEGPSDGCDVPTSASQNPIDFFIKNMDPCELARQVGEDDYWYSDDFGDRVGWVGVVASVLVSRGLDRTLADIARGEGMPFDRLCTRWIAWPSDPLAETGNEDRAEMARMLLGAGCRPYDWTWRALARKGAVRVLEALLPAAGPVAPGSGAGTAIVEALLAAAGPVAPGSGVGTAIVEAAAGAGRVSVLELCDTLRVPIDTVACGRAAAGAARPEVVRWLVERERRAGRTLDPLPLALAAVSYRNGGRPHRWYARGLATPIQALCDAIAYVPESIERVAELLERATAPCAVWMLDRWPERTDALCPAAIEQVVERCVHAPDEFVSLDALVCVLDRRFRFRRHEWTPSVDLWCIVSAIIAEGRERDRATADSFNRENNPDRPASAGDRNASDSNGTASERGKRTTVYRTDAERALRFVRRRCEGRPVRARHDRRPLEEIDAAEDRTREVAPPRVWRSWCRVPIVPPSPSSPPAQSDDVVQTF